MQTKLATTRTANLRRRLLAMLYDGFLLLAILFCVTAVYTMIVIALSGNGIDSQASNVQTGDVLTNLEPVDLGWPYYPLMILTYIGFYLYFWKKTGQTLGMQAWKIKLISKEEKALSTQQLVIRLAGSFLSLGLFGLGYLTLLVNRDAGTWHDRISKTRVISTI